MTKKHRKFFERHLQLLPSSHQGHDVNRMAIIFYSISGLSIFDVNVSAKYGDHLAGCANIISKQCWMIQKILRYLDLLEA